MSTNPSIIVGDVLTNIPPDTLRVAYTKYNNHYHNEATLNNFSYYPLIVGDTINLYKDEELLLSNSKILRISGNVLELEDATVNNQPIEDATLTVPSRNISIEAITVPIRTNEISLVKQSGFVDADTLAQIKTKTITTVLSDYTLNQRILLVPPDLYNFFRIKRVLINLADQGISSVIINKLNSSLGLISSNTINIVNRKGTLIVDQYILGDSYTYVNQGFGITIIGTANPVITITLELITP